MSIDLPTTQGMENIRSRMHTEGRTNEFRCWLSSRAPSVFAPTPRTRCVTIPTPGSRKCDTASRRYPRLRRHVAVADHHEGVFRRGVAREHVAHLGVQPLLAIGRHDGDVASGMHLLHFPGDPPRRVARPLDAEDDLIHRVVQAAERRQVVQEPVVHPLQRLQDRHRRKIRPVPASTRGVSRSAFHAKPKPDERRPRATRPRAARTPGPSSSPPYPFDVPFRNMVIATPRLSRMHSFTDSRSFSHGRRVFQEYKCCALWKSPLARIG